MGSRNQPGEVEERDFPVGPVVKNSSSNAVDTGSMPSRGTKIPYASEQLSPHDITKT